MFIGIDLGTSSVKVSLVDKEGKILAAESQAYPLYSPCEGFYEQNPDEWLDKTVAAIKDLGQKCDLKKVEAISFSGQMHGLVCLDERDAVIRPALLWNDQRTEKQTDYLNLEVGIKKLVELTANRAVTGFTAPKVLWIKENEPTNFAKIKKIMLPKDYIAFKASGAFATDVSDASGTLFFDVEKRCWSKGMLDILGLDESVLPTVYESSEVIGNVTKEFAAMTGLTTSAKVVIGGGDQAVGAIGTGTVGDGNVSISLGTSGVIFVSCGEFRRDDEGRLHNFCHANKKYHYMGVTLSAAASYGWITDVLGESDFDALEKEIRAQGIDDLVFTPYLSGERSPINAPKVKGAFFGLTTHVKRANLCKAVMEGVAFSLRDCLEVIKDAGVKVKKARVIGGGSKSDAWMQILADVLGIEICRINTHDGGALGAGILAMVGTGVYPDVETACAKIVKDVEKFEPDAARAQRYNEKFKTYKRVRDFSVAESKN